MSRGEFVNPWSRWCQLITCDSWPHILQWINSVAPSSVVDQQIAFSNSERFQISAIVYDNLFTSVPRIGVHITRFCCHLTFRKISWTAKMQLTSAWSFKEFVLPFEETNNNLLHISTYMFLLCYIFLIFTAMWKMALFFSMSLELGFTSPWALGWAVCRPRCKTVNHLTSWTKKVLSWGILRLLDCHSVL